MTEELGVVDVSKVPTHMRGDYLKRNNNIENGFKLCKRCNGTGNELYSMYRRCTDCGGTGKAKNKKKKQNVPPKG